MNKPHITVCCVPECPRAIPDTFVMCQSHWRCLDYPTRREVADALLEFRCGRLSTGDLEKVRERAADCVLRRRAKGGAA